MNELDIVHYIQRRQELENLSNEDLARAMLKEAPVFGLLGELAEIAAERLSPGIVERMAEAEAEPQDEPHHVGHPWSHAPRQASNPEVCGPAQVSPSAQKPIVAGSVSTDLLGDGRLLFPEYLKGG